MLPVSKRLFIALRKSHNAHFAEYQIKHDKNQRLSICAAVLAGVSGASILAHASDYHAVAAYKWFIQLSQAILALGASILSTIQNRLDYGKVSEQHRHSAVEFGAMRRRLRFMFHLPVRMRDDVRTYFDRLERREHEMALKSPVISKRVWDAVEKQDSQDPSSLLGE